jgi:hypothetical protein
VSESERGSYNLPNQLCKVNKLREKRKMIVRQILPSKEREREEKVYLSAQTHRPTLSLSIHNIIYIHHARLLCGFVNTREKESKSNFKIIIFYLFGWLGVGSCSFLFYCSLSMITWRQLIWKSVNTCSGGFQ